MISKAQVKHIQSLDDKKYRQQNRQFVVEGEKMVAELLNSSLHVETIYAVQGWIDKNKHLINIDLVCVEDFELKKISALTTPNQVLAIVQKPNFEQIVKPTLAIVLDDIQDPGNLGSMIRIADWYNINALYCSANCADAFSSKVIQASMGSIFRVPVIHCSIIDLLQAHPELNSYACVLGGKDVHTFEKITSGFILIGNESKGLSNEVIALSKHKITIPRKGNAESLNAAIACGIVCDCLL
ncbi:MAG: RNA methyltransferase [Bacteroidetes bacterium]|nr:RNA methyltransferase [Bacteroidota bacterium]